MGRGSNRFSRGLVVRTIEQRHVIIPRVAQRLPVLLYLLRSMTDDVSVWLVVQD